MSGRTRVASQRATKCRTSGNCPGPAHSSCVPMDHAPGVSCPEAQGWKPGHLAVLLRGCEYGPCTPVRLTCTHTFLHSLPPPLLDFWNTQPLTLLLPGTELQLRSSDLAKQTVLRLFRTGRGAEGLCPSSPEAPEWIGLVSFVAELKSKHSRKEAQDPLGKLRLLSVIAVSYLDEVPTCGQLRYHDNQRAGRYR